MTATATFGREGDLVGLIFGTVDQTAHVAHRRTANSDYSRCTLRFRWKSTGLAPLNTVNGPTLTIEGRDQSGEERAWYVRLWNYATGSGTNALIELPFDALKAGFEITPDSEQVDVRDISRMFISLVPPEFMDGSSTRFSHPRLTEVDVSEIECLGSGSVISLNDAVVPEHRMKICTAYDDCYHITPERVIDSLERLGYRDLIDHYVGMSHYPALDGNGVADPAETCVFRRGDGTRALPQSPRRAAMRSSGRSRWNCSTSSAQSIGSSEPGTGSLPEPDGCRRQPCCRRPCPSRSTILDGLPPI